MVGPEVIEEYLIRSGAEYESVEEGTMWILHDTSDNVDNIVIQYSSPLVIFRVKLMTLPAAGANKSALCETLLRLNATEMVQGAYGIEGDSVIASEALLADSMDYDEFQAAVDGLTLAVTEHYDNLKAFHSAPGEA